MNSARLLIAVTLYVSSVPVDAQNNLADKYAPHARETIAQAPLLPFEKVAVTIQLPANWELGRISAVALGRDGVAYVLQRGDKADPVIVVDRNGRVLRSWGKGLFKIPHSIKVDPGGNVWTTDAGDGRVLKFTVEGKQLQEIVLHDAPVGKDCGFPSAAVNNFIDACGTTDMLFLPGGRLFLTDGYGKMRVLEYAADGRRVREWGGPGDGPGQFRVPHGLAYDGKSVLYVADRDNGRLQRFDMDGRYLGEWSHLGRVGAIAFDKGVLWAATGIRSPEPSQTPGAGSSWVIKVDPSTGKVLGKTETTNADFIDVGENGDILAGAARNSFSWFRPTR
jgi:DNA-binding beta-propeller fold protein YncE